MSLWKKSTPVFGFVFYYANPWERDEDEMYADMDDETKQGLLRMESHPDGGGLFTAAVIAE